MPEPDPIAMSVLRRVRLPMYDWPEVHEATLELEWVLQREVMRAFGLPDQVFQDPPPEQTLFESWEDPALLLGQTCGYPLVSFLAGKVVPIATPHYDAPGCEGPLYCSHVLVRVASDIRTLKDLRGKRAAFNSTDSQSGYNAFRHTLAPVAGGQTFFSGMLETGGHVLSMQAVADGQADVCCTDAVCLELARRTRPELYAQLRPIAQTRQVPGLPLIMRRDLAHGRLQTMRDVVAQVFGSPETAAARKALCIRGVSFLDVKDYAPLVAMREEAQAAGYPELA